MDKIAQRKGRLPLLQRIREKVDPGALMEQFTGEDSEFSQLMKLLREVDDQVREDATSLKDLIKSARTYFNRKEYISTISYLGQFHENLEKIMLEFGKLKGSVDKKHHEFLFKDIPDDLKQYFVEKLPSRFETREKKAGLVDWWKGLTSTRTRALKAWEKRFPKFAKDLKKETEKLLGRSESLYQNLNDSLKKMAVLRASRRLEEYLQTVSNLTVKYLEYDKSFENYYNKYAKNFIQQQKEFETKISDEMPTNQIGIEKSRNIEEKVEPEQKSPIGIENLVEKETEKTTQEPQKHEPRPFPKVEENISPKEDPSISSGLRKKPLSNFPIDLVRNKERTTPHANNSDIINSIINAPATDKINIENEPTTEITPSFIYSKTMPSPGVTSVKEPFLQAPSVGKVPTPAHISKVKPTQTIPFEPAEDSTPPWAERQASPPPPPENPASAEVNIPKPPRTPREFSQHTYTDFMEKLTKMSGENSLVLASEIIKFAESISEVDELASKKLLSIAKNIIKQ